MASGKKYSRKSSGPITMLIKAKTAAKLSHRIGQHSRNGYFVVSKFTNHEGEFCARLIKK